MYYPNLSNNDLLNIIVQLQNAPGLLEGSRRASIQAVMDELNRRPTAMQPLKVSGMNRGTSVVPIGSNPMYAVESLNIPQAVMPEVVGNSIADLSWDELNTVASNLSEAEKSVYLEEINRRMNADNSSKLPKYTDIDVNAVSIEDQVNNLVDEINPVSPAKTIEEVTTSSAVSSANTNSFVNPTRAGQSPVLNANRVYGGSGASFAQGPVGSGDAYLGRNADNIARQADNLVKEITGSTPGPSIAANPAQPSRTSYFDNILGNATFDDVDLAMDYHGFGPPTSPDSLWGTQVMSDYWNERNDPRGKVATKSLQLRRNRLLNNYGTNPTPNPAPAPVNVNRTPPPGDNTKISSGSTPGFTPSPSPWDDPGPAPGPTPGGSDTVPGANPATDPVVPVEKVIAQLDEGQKEELNRALTNQPANNTPPASGNSGVAKDYGGTLGAVPDKTLQEMLGSGDDNLVSIATQEMRNRAGRTPTVIVPPDSPGPVSLPVGFGTGQVEVEVPYGFRKGAFETSALDDLNKLIAADVPAPALDMPMAPYSMLGSANTSNGAKAAKAARAAKADNLIQRMFIGLRKSPEDAAKAAADLAGLGRTMNTIGKVAGPLGLAADAAFGGYESYQRSKAMGEDEQARIAEGIGGGAGAAIGGIGGAALPALLAAAAGTTLAAPVAIPAAIVAGLVGSNLGQGVGQGLADLIDRGWGDDGKKRVAREKREEQIRDQLREMQIIEQAQAEIQQRNAMFDAQLAREAQVQNAMMSMIANANQSNPTAQLIQAIYG